MTLTTWWVQPGQRVATMAHTDAFMQGDRFGTVTKVGRKYLHVLMDSGRTRRFRIEGSDGFNPRVPSLRVKHRGDL